MKLSELKTGDKAVIIKVSGYGGFRKRIVEMGFIKGKVVEVLLAAPLKDPIKYGIMGYEVSLRRSEAAQIEVMSLENAKQIAMQDEVNSYYGTLCEEDIRRVALEKHKIINVALVGNPNAGKTSLFNVASGQHARVGNYSGVTVDAKEGEYRHAGYTFKIVDLPGTYSLSAYTPEERYVCNHIISQKPDVIINVVDASNLERNLYLTTQLIAMNVRTVIALNMYDELERRGDTLDVEMLEKLLGLPIIPTVSPKRIGIELLFDTVRKLYEGSDLVSADGHLLDTIDTDAVLHEHLHETHTPHRHKTNHASDLKNGFNFSYVRNVQVNHGPIIERAISALKEELNNSPQHVFDDYTPRYLAIRILEQDNDVESLISTCSNYPMLCKIRDEQQNLIQQEYKESAQTAIMDAKYGFIAGALKETYVPVKKEKGTTLTEKIDRIITNKYLGYPIFIIILFVMFQATFSLGQYPMDWIETFVNWVGVQIDGAMSSGVFKDLLVSGLVGGVGSVLVFLPNILILYFFISLLEASGYMARAAFIMDKLMHRIGLHGRSFIPLIMGFGCNVPAIMATRTIENWNNRMITILINPFMSCSARLPIYLVLAGAFFPDHAGGVLFLMYFTGILLAIIMAKLFSRFLFTKDDTPFVMELPPYRLPTGKNIFLDTWEKGGQYLKKMGTTILFGSIIIWTLSYFPRHESLISGQEMTTEMKEEQQANSYLGRIGHFIEPAMRPLGFDWKVSVAILSGVAAKEVVVSTLGVLYNVDMEVDDTSLPARLREEVRSDGSPAFTPAIAFSLMLFTLIYFPCIATIAAIKHETGTWRWAIFSAVYTVILAWIVSFMFYQSVVHNVWQEVLVAVVLLLTFWWIIERFRKKQFSKSKCDGCSGCNLKR